MYDIVYFFKTIGKYWFYYPIMDKISGVRERTYMERNPEGRITPDTWGNPKYTFTQQVVQKAKILGIDLSNKIW